VASPRGLSPLDRELARLLAKALVRDYQERPPSHAESDGRNEQEGLDVLLPEGYQRECPSDGGGPAQPLSACAMPEAGLKSSLPNGSAARETPLPELKPATDAHRSRSSSG
jgi:hypothetical protein